MTEKKNPPPPVPLCRFEELAERENRLREEAARKQKSRGTRPISRADKLGRLNATDCGRFSPPACGRGRGWASSDAICPPRCD